MAAPQYYITKIGHWRKDGLERNAPYCFTIFLQKIFARLTLLFLHFSLNLKPREKCFFFRQWAWSRDRDIIFRDWTYLVFCFFGCVVKFQAREANSWRRGASSNPVQAFEFVYFFTFFLSLFVSLFSFLFFFFLPTLTFLSRSNAHRLTQNKGGKISKRSKRPKGEREQFASLDLWIID